MKERPANDVSEKALPLSCFAKSEACLRNKCTGEARFPAQGAGCARSDYEGRLGARAPYRSIPNLGYAHLPSGPKMKATSKDD